MWWCTEKPTIDNSWCICMAVFVFGKYILNIDMMSHCSLICIVLKKEKGFSFKQMKWSYFIHQNTSSFFNKGKEHGCWGCKTSDLHVKFFDIKSIRPSNLSSIFWWKKNWTISKERMDSGFQHFQIKYFASTNVIPDLYFIIADWIFLFS